MDRAPDQENMANKFLVEISNFTLWPLNPTHIATLTADQRDRKQEELVVELSQVRKSAFSAKKKKNFPGGLTLSIATNLTYSKLLFCSLPSLKDIATNSYEIFNNSNDILIQTRVLLGEFSENSTEDAKRRMELLETTIGNCMDLMYILALDGQKHMSGPAYTARIRDSAHSM